MKKIYLLLFAVLAVLQLSAQDRVTQIREKLMNRDQSSVIVVAHRGDWRNFPENSLEAIDNAVRMGVDIVELDVKKTKDGELILMHDRALDRTTTGKGLVSEATLDYIRGLKLKNGCNIFYFYLTEMAAAATMAVAAATITASGSSAFYAYVAAMAVMH